MEKSRREQILDVLSGQYFRIEPREEFLELYDTALTHSSFAKAMEQKNMPCKDNEKLEFFGNYILDYVVAEHLHDLREYAPGEMNNRIKVTGNANLADIVVRNNLKIDEALRLGGSTKPTMKITANAFEAFIGAIHCAEGVEKAREVILGIFIEELKNFDPDGNYKGRLQEHIARHSLGELKYRPSDEGPGHKKVWRARVYLNGEEIAQGVGFSRKRAEMNAAREALQKLNVE